MDVVRGCVCVQSISPVSYTQDCFTGTRPGKMSSWPRLLPEAPSDSMRVKDTLCCASQSQIWPGPRSKRTRHLASHLIHLCVFWMEVGAA